MSPFDSFKKATGEVFGNNNKNNNGEDVSREDVFSDEIYAEKNDSEENAELKNQEDEMARFGESDTQVEDLDIYDPIASEQAFGNGDGPMGGGPQDDEGEYGDVPTTSLISKDTSIVGQISAGGNLDIRGKVKGDVTAKGNVAVRGNVTGDIKGENIGLRDCKVKGDIKADSNVLAGEDAVIQGDVNTERISLAGRLKGDIKAKEMVVLKSNAFYLGDISSGGIVVEPGAVLNGQVSIAIAEDIEKEFD